MFDTARLSIYHTTVKQKWNIIYNTSLQMVLTKIRFSVINVKNSDFFVYMHICVRVCVFMCVCVCMLLSNGRGLNRNP